MMAYQMPLTRLASDNMSPEGGIISNIVPAPMTSSCKHSLSGQLTPRSATHKHLRLQRSAHNQAARRDIDDSLFHSGPPSPPCQGLIDVQQGLTGVWRLKEPGVTSVSASPSWRARHVILKCVRRRAEVAPHTLISWYGCCCLPLRSQRQ